MFIYTNRQAARFVMQAVDGRPLREKEDTSQDEGQ